MKKQQSHASIHNQWEIKSWSYDDGIVEKGDAMNEFSVSEQFTSQSFAG